MQRWRALVLGGLLFAALPFAFFKFPPVAKAQSGARISAAQGRANLLGGAHGMVRTDDGVAIEGVMVQLISQKTSIRTTVYSDVRGHFEFPKLESGTYLLRIPRPLEFRRYQRDSVQIDDSTQLEDIVLQRLTNSEFLPPTPDIIPQITDAEWLYNLDGTAEEKQLFSHSCSEGCHGMVNVMSSRFDEQSWRLVMHRMMDYAQRILVMPVSAERLKVSPSASGTNEREMLTKWLARVRGPESTLPPLKVFPRPQGAATRMVVTEYELPWLGTQVHDVSGDDQGNIWFTINKSPLIGKLDPKTGKITSYTTPVTPGWMPGGHMIKWTKKDGMVWFTQTWPENLVRFDPRTEEFHVAHTGIVGGNMAISPGGTFWQTDKGSINEYDPMTGQAIKKYPLKRIFQTYGNFISRDGKYYGGGNLAKDSDGVLFMDFKSGEIKEVRSPSGRAKPSRGSFDPEGNIWVGGRGQVLVKYDHRTGIIEEHTPPTPYANFYEAMADKNGEVWAGKMPAGRMARFNPHNSQWTEYVLPEPYAYDFRTWVDNSTNPVTVWYGDLYGYIVRIQPLE